MTPGAILEKTLLTSFSPSISGATARHCKSVMAPCKISCCDLAFLDAFQSSTRSNRTVRCSGVHLSGMGQNRVPPSVASSFSELELEGVDPKSSPLSSASAHDITIRVGDVDAAGRVLLAGTRLLGAQEPRCCI